MNFISTKPNIHDQDAKKQLLGKFDAKYLECREHQRTGSISTFNAPNPYQNTISNRKQYFIVGHS